MLASTYNLVYIALERHTALRYPHAYKDATPKKIKFALLFLHIVSFSSLTPQMTATSMVNNYFIYLLKHILPG